MRITLEFDNKSSKTAREAMLAFHDAEKAVEYLKANPTASVILTREAADQFLGEYYEQLDDLQFQLMHEIDPMDDGEPSEDGTLNFTNVQGGDIESIHDSVPCGAERREFVRLYECWQLWCR